MQKELETVTDGIHWPDKAVVRELYYAFHHTDGDHCALAMEGLKNLDSYGLEMLVLMSELAEAKGVTLTIRRPQGQVKELISLAEVDRLIPIEN